MPDTTLTITLYTADGFTGSYEIGLNGAGFITHESKMIWDGDPCAHTIAADLGDVTVSGDLWRRLEDEGGLDDVIRSVAAGDLKSRDDILDFIGSH